MQRQLWRAARSATEVNHCIGSKPALAMLPGASLIPVTFTLDDVPGIPSRGRIRGTTAAPSTSCRLLAENDFLPDLGRFPPTCGSGPIAGADYSEQSDRQGGDAGILRAGDRVCSNQSDRGRAGRRHILLTFSASRSAFCPFRAREEVGVEVHSLSKAFNMIGCGSAGSAATSGSSRRWLMSKTTPDPANSSPFRGGRSRLWMTIRSPCRFGKSTGDGMAKLVQALTRCGFVCRMPAVRTSCTPGRRAVCADGPAFDTGRGGQPVPGSPSIRSSPCRGTTPGRSCGSVTYEAADEAAEDAFDGETVSAPDRDSLGVLGAVSRE